MKLFLNAFLLILCFSFFSLHAKATGHETGNGGGAVVCRNAQKEIVSAQVLDLWEARTLQHNLQEENSKSVEDWVEAIIFKISESNPLFAVRVRWAYQDNQKIQVPVPTGTAIVPPTDARNWLMESNCALEGAAEYVYQPEGPRLYIDPSAIGKMSNIDQAGLWIHEAIYKVLREEDLDQDSIRTRDMVGTLFSKEELAKVSTNPTFSCFYDLSADANSYGFSFLASPENQTLHGWVMRVDNKWQLPAIAINPALPVDDQKFVSYLLLPHFTPANHSFPSVINQLYQYRVEGQLRSLTMVLVKNVMPSDQMYDFAVFPKAGAQARCAFH